MSTNRETVCWTPFIDTCKWLQDTYQERQRTLGRPDSQAHLKQEVILLQAADSSFSGNPLLCPCCVPFRRNMLPAEWCRTWHALKLRRHLCSGRSPVQQVGVPGGVQDGRGGLPELVAAVPLLIRPVVEHTVVHAHLQGPAMTIMCRSSRHIDKLKIWYNLAGSY